MTLRTAKNWSNRMIQLADRLVVRFGVPPESRDEGGLHHWRQRILYVSLAFGMAFGTLVLLTTIPVLLSQGHYSLVLMDSCIYLLGLAALLRRQSSFRYKAGLVLILIYAIGVGVLSTRGTVSGGLAYLFAFTCLTSVLLGLRAAWAAWVLNMVTFIILGWLSLNGLLEKLVIQSPTEAIVAALNFLFINAVVAVAAGVLVQGLERVHLKEQQAATDLKTERLELIKLNHLLEYEIEERKATEKALKENEERFRQMAQLLPETIFEMDLEGKLTFVNQIAYKTFGYSHKDFVKGINALDLLVPKDRERGLFNIQRRLRGEIEGGNEYTARRKDGTELPIVLSSNPIIKSGHTVGLRGLLVDITNQKQAEKDLQRSEQRYRDLFDSINDLIYTQDLEGRFLSINQAITATLGYEVHELIGRKASHFLRPDLKDAFEAEYLAEIKKKGEQGGISPYLTKGGSLVFLEYKSVLVQPTDGDAYISGMGRDITDRILAERELRLMEEQLTQSQKMEAVGTLASGIAHDFNNILQAISGYVQVLLLKDISAPDRTSLRRINEAVDRAAELVRRLLTFSRKSRVELIALNLNREVDNIIPLLSRTIPREIDIETRLTPEPYLINGDPTQVEQILMNLGTNARDAMPNGGRLTIETKNLEKDKNLEELLLKPGPYLQLKISDTGLGMDEETRMKAFDPFFTTKGVDKGTGLGLTSVYGIVKDLGGIIRCHSQLGHGTTFEISLPAMTNASAGQLEKGTKERSSIEIVSGTEGILLVDDEEAILDIGQSFLKELGYRVIIAHSGEQALEVYRKKGREVDLVVMDLSMPGMGGRSCMDELLRLDSQVKVLVASGYAAQEEAKAMIEAGAAGFIGKPYQLKSLLKKIREILTDQG